jgi:hypothetical protein
LGLYFSEIRDIVSKLEEAEGFPERQRPPKEWRNTKWSGYLLGLGRLCLWFGLVGPLSWVHPSGRGRLYWIGPGTEAWIETFHYFLQEKSKARVCWYLYDIALLPPYPWLKQPPRRRGRPAMPQPGSREFKERKVLACCIAKRLLRQSWEEIADNCGLTARKGDDTPGTLEVATRCRRLAKALKIYHPFRQRRNIC